MSECLVGVDACRPEALAKTIADAAHHFSLDRGRRSPFTFAAEAHRLTKGYGGKGYLGGKQDDIAVVVGVVKKRETRSADGEGGHQRQQCREELMAKETTSANSAEKS